ncbi:MAG: hypothetical protein PHQ43_15895 [Dehalococcoidales bacterium]|nr:hypothetical protein [Dehalococcoidales bacterium]
MNETWAVYLKRELGDVIKEWFLRVEEKQGSLETPIEGFAVLLAMPEDMLLFKPLRSRRGNHHRFAIDPVKVDKEAIGYCGMIHTHPIHAYGANTDDEDRITEIYPLMNPMSEVDKDNVLKREAVVEAVIYRRWGEVKLQAIGHIYRGDPTRFSTVSLGEAPLPKWLRRIVGVKPKNGEGEKKGRETT